MTKPNSTEIVILLDRSGSMSKIAADMCGGFDRLISDQKKLPGECKVTLIQFDSRTEADPGYEVKYEAIDLHQVPKLELIPRGLTALLDALGKAIFSTGVRLASLSEKERPSQILFVIITDGEENASTEYSRNQIFEMISHQKEKYSWEFVFLGANQDAIAAAKGIGIMKNAITYSADAGGTERLIQNLSDGISRYRTVGNKRMENIVDQQAYDASLVKK